MLFKFDFKKFSTSEICKCSELTVKQHKAIAKYITSGNDANTWNAFSELIETNSGRNDLSFFDKVLLLLKTKVLCIAPTKIKLSVNCPSSDKKYDTTIDTVLIYNGLYNALEKFNPVIINDAGYSVTIHHPFFTALPATDQELVLSLINKVSVANSELDFRFLDVTEKQKIYDALPAGLTSKIIVAIKEIEKEFNKIFLLKLHSPYVRGVTTEIPFSINHTASLEFLKILFSLDLADHYRTCYALTQEAGITLTEIENMTPSEKTVYWKQHQEQQKANAPKAANNQIEMSQMSAPEQI